jgi:hypothetical protein
MLRRGNQNYNLLVRNLLKISRLRLPLGAKAISVNYLELIDFLSKKIVKYLDTVYKYHIFFLRDTG